MDQLITLNCWVYGSNVDSVFSVTISKAKSVGALKMAIKNNNPVPFRHVWVHSLHIYAIHLGSDAPLEVVLKQWSPENETKLNGRIKLFNLFREDDDREWVIIVNIPTFVPPPCGPSVIVSDMTLNCWIYGDDVKNIFPVKISKTASVGELKVDIKNMIPSAFRGVDAPSLHLYKISVPINDDLGVALQNSKPNDEKSLDPWKILSDIFFDVPLKEYLHVVVKVAFSVGFPTCTPLNVEAQRRTFLNNNALLVSSTADELETFSERQAAREHTIFCNRPHTACASIPVTLLHNVFSQFLDNCETHNITPGDNSFAEELHIAMSDFYSTELSRVNAISDVLWRWKIYPTVTVTTDGPRRDDDMFKNNHYYLITTIENEVGSARADPWTQASLMYLKLTSKSAVAMAGSTLPCIIVILFGPYITFAGGAWESRPVIQTLSHPLPMHYHDTDINMRMKVARHLGALKKAIHALEEYYRGLTSAVFTSSLQLFPYPAHFLSLQDNR
ncbi:hypothetical protein ID866_9916 [Astraeus odoratus]|nr:hypothetical protein ID866_9916 [Astraeus odoratus]